MKLAALAPPDLYQARVDRLCAAAGSNGRSWMRALREQAFQDFVARGLPTPRDEDWKDTSLEPLKRATPAAWDPAESTPAGRGSGNGDDLAGLSPLSWTRPRLVFLDGRLQPAASSVAGLPPGAIVGSLADALVNHAALVRPYLETAPDAEASSLVALNTALMEDGAFVYLPDGVRLEEPLHLVFLSSGASAAWGACPRNLVVLGPAAGATILQSHLEAQPALGGSAGFENIVTDLVLGDGAALDHGKIQRASPEAFHVETTRVRAGAASRFETCSVTLGARLARNELRASLVGEGARCRLSGLYMADGTRHVDQLTVVDHVAGHCWSDQDYRGILDGAGRAVFTGRVVVRPDAQKTDARQANKNLLLSDSAIVNTHPQLRIFADDVKCSHAVSVGTLDETAMFYLRSRGIGVAEARAMLLRAFAGQMLERLPDAVPREIVEAWLFGEERRWIVCE